MEAKLFVGVDLQEPTVSDALSRTVQVVEVPQIEIIEERSLLELRQPESGGSLGLDGELGAEDRRAHACDPPQRQSLQRHHVSGPRFLHQPQIRPGLRRDPHEVGTALRGDADQGRRRGASDPLAGRPLRGLRDLGQREFRPGAQGAGHVAQRVCSGSFEARSCI